MKTKEITVILLAIAATLVAASLFAEASDAEVGDAHTISMDVQGGQCFFKDFGETIPQYTTPARLSPRLVDGDTVAAGSYVYICPNNDVASESHLVSLAIEADGQPVPYEIVKLSETSPLRHYYFVMPDADVKVDIKFDGLTITIDSEHGTAKAGIKSGWSMNYALFFFEGDTVTLTCTADSGYSLKSWEVISGDVVIAGDQFVMGDRDVEIRAVFKELEIGETVTLNNIVYALSSLDPFECKAVEYVDDPIEVTIRSVARFGNTDARVVSMSDKMFYGCSTVETLWFQADIPVSYKAFAWCDSLSYVNFQGNVEEISAGAFHGCENITSLTIPSSVKTLGRGAFYGLTFTDIDGTVLSKTVKALRGHTFEGSDGVLVRTPEVGDTFTDSGLTYVIEKIGNNPVGATLTGYTEDITDLVIPNFIMFSGKRFEVYAVGSKAFYGCESLNSIQIGGFVKEVGYKAFAQCKSLETLTLSRNCVLLGDYSFYGCESLKALELPSNPMKDVTIGLKAFAHCMALASVKLSVTSYYKVSVGDYAFYMCPSLENVELENRAGTSIGARAFAKCTSLASLTLPSNVTSVGDYAFYGCSALSSLSVEIKGAIGISAFSECKGLETVSVGSAVTELGNNAFFRCKFFSSEGERLEVTAEALAGHTFEGTFNKLIMTA